MSIPRTNNFDLIRLLAATQVVVGHICTEISPAGSAVLLPAVWWMGLFPGVPIFFTVSGFLIYWSFERNADRIGSFFKNRFLRIYPGLWVCFAVTLAVLAVFGQITPATLASADFWGWAARQLTFFQFGTPECFKHWGDRQVNRSLWTISIELQFYVLVPVIYYVMKRLGKHWTIGWAVLFFGSIGVYELQCLLPASNILHKTKEVGIFSCLYNFLYGVAFYKCWGRVKPLVDGRCLYWLAAYVLFVYLSWNHYQVWPYSPEPLRMLGYFLLSGLTISAAFSVRTLSKRLLRGFDISYGVYIYHGLVLNCFLALGWMRRWDLAILVLPVSYTLGAASWVLVERPMLQRKSKTRTTACGSQEPAAGEAPGAPACGSASLEEPAVASAGVA